ncbi:adenosylcobinamide-GDP ribazoletransferase [Cytobacillus sp. Hz8]|uniref:adenosylcobinamide-GDP ribazoletransferase n=1 Tax=Cytobacillus sp. Hz8 TaxID=3347168 RepID=UPI0035D7426E
MKWIKGLLINVQFFTAIPLPLELPMDSMHLKKAIQTFPLLGILQGALFSTLLWGLTEWSPFSQLAIAFLIWCATILITGGIHLDGWIDASDAYFSFRDIHKRLEIMKDPRTGAFGVLSVLLLLSSRFLFIYEIVKMLQPETYFAISLIPFFSKSVLGGVLLSVPSAKKEGLGALFQAAATFSSLWVYLIYFGFVFLFLIIMKIDFLVLPLILFLVSILGYLFLRRKIVKWFSGITGDLLGASVEGIEWLLWITLWLLHYFVMV